MKLTTRLHEWLADRFDWVQYPNIRQAQPQQLRFKYKMPLLSRMALFGFSLVILLLASGALILFLVALYGLVFR